MSMDSKLFEASNLICNPIRVSHLHSNQMYCSPVSNHKCSSLVVAANTLQLCYLFTVSNSHLLLTAKTELIITISLSLSPDKGTFSTLTYDLDQKKDLT